jgi:tetratricopeptide (TPR) repeat protein
LLRQLRRRALIAVAAALTGCASAPAPTPPAPSPDVSSARADIERAAARHRALALKFEKEHDLADAANHWQVVLLLLPDDRQAVAQLAALRRAIAKIVGDELGAARDAQRRTDFDKAEQSMLRVLAYDPYNQEAVAALREIDRQRATRRAAERAARARMEEKTVASRSRTARRSAPTEAGEYDVEQSIELLRAGDVMVALPELRRYAQANPRDRAARERIAVTVYAQAQQLQGQGADAAAVSMYADAIKLHPAPPRGWTEQLAQLKMRLANQEYEQGVRLMATDVPAAIAHFEAALRLAPDHTQAQLRLERARKIQENLRSIGTTRKSG